MDNSNNGFKKAGSNVYTTGTAQVGIGTSTPAYDLHIKQTNAAIGLTDAATNKVSATITASDEDVIMNAYRTTAGAGGNIILQRSGFIGSTPINAGNVGIGVPYPSVPAEKLQVNGNLRLQTATGRLIFHNGTSERGEVFVEGNDAGIGTAPGNTTGRLLFSAAGTSKLAMLNNGELIRLGLPGAANLLPLAYGKVSETGAVLSGTGNFTAVKTSEGVYKITLTGETNVYTNRNTYTILVTAHPSYWTNRMMADANIESDNTIEIRLSAPKIYWTNSSCSQSCGPFSYITGFKFHEERDNPFSILIYKQ